MALYPVLMAEYPNCSVSVQAVNALIMRDCDLVESDWKIKGNGAVVIDGRLRIDFSAPLEDLHAPNAQAFAASDKESPQQALVAYICRADLPQRLHFYTALEDRAINGILKVFHSGVVEIDGDHRRYFILERPIGGRVMNMSAQNRGFSEPIVTERFLPVLIEILDSLDHQDLTHRRIRPENLYYRDKGQQALVLGEGFTEPPGYSQPAIFETVERSMAHPIGRGEGTGSSDLYALGVTLTMLLKGDDPTAGKSDRQIQEMKMSKGSFVTLVGDHRLTGPTEKLLRGLLNDDISQRWTIEDTKGWSWGNTRSLRHIPSGVRARRPLVIGDEEIFYDRMAALKIATLGDGATEFVKKSGLVGWIKQSLGDKDKAEYVAQAIAEAQPGNSLANDLLVTRVCGALDPLGPVRYRGLALCNDGFGAAVASALGTGDIALQGTLGEFFKTNYLAGWESSQKMSREKSGGDIDYAKLTGWMENAAPGFGLERCLYELNQATPCLSPMIITFGALDLGSVLQCINAAIVSANEGVDIFDRHVAAFVAARSEDAAKLVPALSVSGGDPAERNLTIIGLFGAMQTASDCGALINLAKRMEDRLPPILELYHSKNRRKNLSEQARLHASVGDLSGMFKVVGNRKMRRLDESECRQGAAEYAELNKQLKDLESGSRRITNELKLSGYKAATILGALVLAASLWFSIETGL